MNIGRRVGKEVAFLTTTPENTRNGEGDFIQLKNGDIMYAYTEYLASKHDHGEAYITAVFSSDNGESFGDKRRLFGYQDDDINHMSVSLVRLNNGDIGILYIAKYPRKNGQVGATNYFCTSSDEGKTWSKRVMIGKRESYLGTCNARMIKLQSGRVLVPVSYYEDADHDGDNIVGRIHFWYSDDNGKTWQESPNIVENPVDYTECGLQESGVHQCANGRIIAFSRTCCGSQFVCFSDDDGISWTSPVHGYPNLISPDAPMMMKTLKNNQTVVILNPIPGWLAKGQMLGANGSFNRTPFICLVFNGDGSDLLDQNAPWAYYVEDDRRHVYCYPSIFVGDDYFLVGYYHSNGGHSLNCGKIKKIMYSEIDHEDTDLKC